MNLQIIPGLFNKKIKLKKVFDQIIDTAKTKLQENNDTDINENWQIGNKNEQTLNLLVI